MDIHHSSTMFMEDNKNKRLPTADDLNPNLKFVENPILVGLLSNITLKKEITNRKVSWQSDFDLVKKLFNEIKASDEYKEYMSTTTSTIAEDKKFLENIIRNVIADSTVLEFWLEEKNIHWADDYFIAVNALLKTIETAKTDGSITLSDLYKDAEDDKLFARTLLTKCIIHNGEYEELISAKTQNWEIERVAFLDVLLMKMAITEVMHVPNIPIKVSMNEYIEISKQYSTPKSKIFINGVLDKVVAELKAGNKIQKSGRGLLES